MGADDALVGADDALVGADDALDEAEDDYEYNYPTSSEDEEEEEEVNHDTIIRDWAQNNSAITHAMINDLIRKDNIKYLVF